MYGAGAATSCSVNPASYSLASGASIGTVAVTTTALSAAALTGRLPFDRPTWLSPIIALLLCTMTVWPAGTRRHLRGWIAAPALLVLLTIGIGLPGCGGGANGGGGAPPPQTGTPAGTYTVTVTGTSGTLSHTTTLTLVVQ